MVVQILKSLGFTVLVSGSLSYFLTNFNITFWSSFIVITVFQIAGWNIFQYIQQRRDREAQTIQEQEIIQDITRQSALISCAGCGEENLVPIRFDINNRFDCEYCDKANTVFVEIETAITTQPVN